MTGRVVVLRPYAEVVRRSVLQLLERAGVDTSDAIILPPRSTDKHVVAALASVRPKVLIVPFHAHEDDDGNRLNGLELIAQIFEELPLLESVPIVMPASAQAMAAAQLGLESSIGQLSAAQKARVFLLHLDRLADTSIVAEIRHHLRS